VGVGWGGSIHRICVGPQGGVGRWSALVFTSLTNETTKIFNAESLKGSKRSPVMFTYFLIGKFQRAAELSVDCDRPKLQSIFV
jgi:hypothetical protein